MKTIIKIMKGLSCVCVSFFALNCQAVISYTQQDNQTHALVNEWPVPSKSVDLFHQYVSSKNPELTESQLLKSIIENHLLTEHVKKTIGLKTISDETKVGFTQNSATQAQLINILKHHYQKNISESITKFKGGNLNSIITMPFKISESTINKSFKMSKTMEYKASRKQIEELKDIQLLGYQFPKNESQSITLFEIYQQTNIQEKISLFQADIPTLKRLTYQHLSSLYVLYWVKQFTNISENELNALKKFVSDNRTARQYHLYSGAKSAVHHSNQTLRKLAKSISQEEITQYYRSHKEEFKTVKKVKARHIQLSSQSQADKVHQALKNGLNFNMAIEKYSQAKDKSDAIAGDLGWINRGDVDRDWLHTLPFTQKKAGEFSAPFMSPKRHYATPVWEIIYLDERIMGYLDPSSKTVKYNASKAIAKNKISQSVIDIKQKIWNEAKVNLNKGKISNDLFSEKTPLLNVFNTGHQHSKASHEH